MRFFRSTLVDGASWHAWPDSKNQFGWSLPGYDKPGAWREALSKPTTPHGNGLHAAKFHALAYWFGPCNYIMEADTDAQQPGDHPLDDIQSDIVVARRARLLRVLPISLEKWQDISIQSLRTLNDFPHYYKYKGRYDQRAFSESHEHPGAYPIFQKAKMKYDWKEAIDETDRFFKSMRHDPNYTAGVLQKNIRYLGDDYQESAQDICKRLDQIELQQFAHKQSVARCEEYEHHSDAMIHGMHAVSMLKKWLHPWVENAPRPGIESEKNLASFCYGINKDIVQNVNRAYRATGAEQYRLMMLDPAYTMDTGVGPLLADLQYLPERNLNGFSPVDLAGRGIMLKLGEFIANGLDIPPLYDIEMRRATPLKERFSKIIEAQRQISLD